MARNLITEAIKTGNAPALAGAYGWKYGDTGGGCDAFLFPEESTGGEWIMTAHQDASAPKGIHDLVDISYVDDEQGWCGAWCRGVPMDEALEYWNEHAPTTSLQLQDQGNYIEIT